MTGRRTKQNKNDPDNDEDGSAASKETSNLMFGYAPFDLWRRAFYGLMVYHWAKTSLGPCRGPWHDSMTYNHAEWVYEKTAPGTSEAVMALRAVGIASALASIFNDTATIVFAILCGQHIFSSLIFFISEYKTKTRARLDCDMSFFTAKISKFLQQNHYNYGTIQTTIISFFSWRRSWLVVAIPIKRIRQVGSTPSGDKSSSSISLLPCGRRIPIGSPGIASDKSLPLFRSREPPAGFRGRICTRFFRESSNLSDCRGCCWILPSFVS